MATIKEGDIVRLNSGGPLMTVIHLTAGSYAADHAPLDKAYCQWFTQAGGKPDGETFPLTSLMLIDS